MRGPDERLRAGEAPPLEVEALPAVPLDEALLSALAPGPEFTGGNRATLLRGGVELFPAMHEAVAAARREIWIATYIFNDDPAALGLLAALCEAAARGVRLRVVVDGFGSFATLEHLQSRLEAAGAEFAVFRPLRGWWSWVQPGQLRRLHLKLALVDGRVGFVGGVNLIDDRLDLRHGWSEQPRFDFAVRLEGPVLLGVADTLRAVFTRARMGRHWPGELVALARASQPVQEARRLIERLRIGGPGGGPGTPGRDEAAGLPPQRVAFVVRDNLRRRRTIERAYVDAIRQARHRVTLVCPYFYPGRAFRLALREAAGRGVEVRLLMQGRWDYRAAALAARALYAELLGRGVRIHEYTPAFLHAKAMTVDDDWATVGSSNIDPLSLLLNLEANVIVCDAAFTGALAGELDAAFAVSREVRPEEVGGRLDLLRRAFVAWCARVFLRVAGATGRY